MNGCIYICKHVCMYVFTPTHTHIPTQLVCVHWLFRQHTQQLNDNPRLSTYPNCPIVNPPAQPPYSRTPTPTSSGANPQKSVRYRKKTVSKAFHVLLTHFITNAWLIGFQRGRQKEKEKGRVECGRVSTSECVCVCGV